MQVTVGSDDNSSSSVGVGSRYCLGHEMVQQELPDHLLVGDHVEAFYGQSLGGEEVLDRYPLGGFELGRQFDLFGRDLL